MAKHSNLVHKQVAYREIYLKNKAKYPLPFSKYLVHHIDGDKQNNHVSNLQIVTREEHEKIHGIASTKINKNGYREINLKDPNFWYSKKGTFTIILVTLVLATMLIWVTFPSTKDLCKQDIFDCDSFKYQEMAQNFYEFCGGTENDVHYLDGDKDGIACESLPSEQLESSGKI